jgi:hypothetical protein
MRNKRVLNNFFLCFMILALCVPGISNDSKVECKWTASPVKIDGSNNDWAGDPLTAEKKVKVDYAFRNDSENLYVLFIFNDPKFLSTINQTGMTLWLNTEGKKGKDYGIKFNIKTITADTYIALVEKQVGALPEEKKNEIKKTPTYRIFQNEVIDKEGEDFIITGGPAAPAFMLRPGKNMMIYEFRIPLKKGEGQPVGIGTEPGKDIKIGFEWGGLTKEMIEARTKRLGASGAKGRAGEATRSLTQERRVGSGSASLSSIRRGAKRYSFWVDLSLAQK